MVAVKSGFEIKAVIAPAKLHDDEQYLNSINRIASLYRTMSKQSAHDGREDKQPQPNSGQNELFVIGGGQATVDLETGEIITQ